MAVLIHAPLPSTAGEILRGSGVAASRVVSGTTGLLNTTVMLVFRGTSWLSSAGKTRSTANSASVV